MEDKIFVTSTVNHTVVLKLPETHFRRVWSGKGQKFPMTREQLEEAMYNTGAQEMFRAGTLYIEDMEIKKEFGLEPEDADKPTNIILLSDKEIDEQIYKKQAWELKEIMLKLQPEHQKEFAAYAISKGNIDFKKAEIIKEITKIDVLRTIELNKQNEEAPKEDNR